jgi:hypothetical protein
LRDSHDDGRGQSAVEFYLKKPQPLIRVDDRSTLSGVTGRPESFRTVSTRAPPTEVGTQAASLVSEPETQ